MVKKRRIITSNTEIYEKLNMLQITSDVVIKHAAAHQITKIINNINKFNKCISVERIGNYFLLKKEGPLEFSIYFNKVKK